MQSLDNLDKNGILLYNYYVNIQAFVLGFNQIYSLKTMKKYTGGIYYD